MSGGGASARRRPSWRTVAAAVTVVLALVVAGVVSARQQDGSRPTAGSTSTRSPSRSAVQQRDWFSPFTLQGFGAGTEGGRDGPVAEVTSLADSGPGTLRALLSKPGPSWVRFAVSGAIVLSSPVTVPSDTTIDGRGADVTLENKGLEIDGVHDVIVENMKFTAIRGATSDAISVKNHARDVWIDHSDFSDGRDGLVDITYGATDVTVSWCHFFKHDKVMLISVLKGTGQMQVTVHHNWFDHTNQRNPLVRDAYAHVFDNYVDGFTAYGMQAQHGGYLLAQDNVLQAQPGTGETDGIRIADGKWGEGVVRADGDVLLDGATQLERFAWLLHPVAYRYDLQPAGASLAHEITAFAGWRPYPADTTSVSPLPLA